MKKLLSLLVALSLVLSVGTFASCTSVGNSSTGSDMVATEFAPIAKEDLKIGVMHLGHVDDTVGYTAAHKSGIDYMKAELGITDAQVIEKGPVSDTNAEEINATIDSLIADDCNVVIGTSYGYMEPMLAKSQEYPDVIFSHGTGYLAGPNMNNYFGRIYQARYLSGIVAGAKSLEIGNNTLGYVAAFTSVPEVVSGYNAFLLGAQSVNPDAVLKVKEIGSWFDPAKEISNAEALLNAGCGVISHHSDTLGVCQTVADSEDDVFSVGYNTNMEEFITGDKDSVLTSVTWNWGIYYKQFIGSVIDGTFRGFESNYYGSLADDLFEISDCSTAVDAATKAKVDSAKALIVAGDFDVFTDFVLEYNVETNVATPVAKTLMKFDDTAYGEVTVAMITGSMVEGVKGVEILA